MSAKFFLDTNILIYTFDRSAPVKQRRASELLGEALEEQRGVISYQVVQEFVNASSKKFAVPLKSDDLAAYLKEILLPLCEVQSSPGLFRDALTLREETGFSFYDCLILAAASEAGCSVLYSEDLQHGRKVAGVRIQNPF